MNESAFENELRKLRPAAPSRELEDAIARGLAGHREAVEAPRELRSGTSDAPTPWFMLWLDRLLWTGVGAAAAVILLMSAQKPQAEPHEKHVVSRAPEALDASALQPVLASEEDLGWRDEGVQFNASGQPMLKLRRVSVERKAWADLVNAGVVQSETPRQEVMWVPVTLH